MLVNIKKLPGFVSWSWIISNLFSIFTANMYTVGFNFQERGYNIDLYKLWTTLVIVAMKVICSSTMTIRNIMSHWLTYSPTQLSTRSFTDAYTKSWSPIHRLSDLWKVLILWKLYPNAILFPGGILLRWNCRTVADKRSTGLQHVYLPFCFRRYAVTVFLLHY